MPNITIWVTEHFIAQRIGLALKMGLGSDAVLAVASTATADQIAATPVHIGYGILRGMDHVARLAAQQNKDWFHLDLGYTGPGHFHGNYRVGYRGTQALYDDTYQSDAAPPPLADWRAHGHYALICPPTDYVAAYYAVDAAAWCHEAEALATRCGFPAKLRRKGDTEPLEQALADAAVVITFNSSVGWQALAKGIPCYSSVTGSTVGSWHGAVALGDLEKLKACDRQKLFRFMQASQLTLLEIQQGKIRDILRRYTHII